MNYSEAQERDMKRYLANVENSKGAVNLAADWLRSRGYNVKLGKQKVIERSYLDRMKHIDNGDLFVYRRIEVKHRSLSFTCREDFPFDSAIVCSCNSFDNADPKPSFYMEFNKDLTHFMLIRLKTSIYWYKKKVKDNRYEAMNQQMYFVDKEYLEFYPVNHQKSISSEVREEE